MGNANRITIHLVGNAHIDPVWLWNYSAGVTEAISTCHTAAALIDAYDDFVFTRADSWVYEQIENYDPALFARIREHVRDGRWDTTGGWYLQPDCNFPTEEAFLAHMRIGTKYFHESFGVDVTTGMNVDSFGHTAFLPRFLRQSGFDSYVFMRPGRHERELPSELFRWQSPDEHEVLTWRIQQSYNADTPAALEKNIEACLAAEVPGIPHVLCYYGVGDHGGGPTAKLIEWIKANKDSYPGAVLRFSSPTTFFRAAREHEDAVASLPAVVGELQYHAVGCYSVLGSFKRKLRNAESRVIEAGRLNGSADLAEPPLDEMWKPVLLNQFHDTAGGTCIESAYKEAEGQLGLSATLAEESIAAACYRKLVSLPPSKVQRMVLFNPAAAPFRGPVTHEPWIEWKGFEGTLRDSAGMAVPYQISQQSALLREKRNMTWIAEIPPDGRAEYLLDPVAPTHGDAEGRHWSVREAEGDINLLEITAANSKISAVMDLRVIEDKSDTWSHDIASYQGTTLGHFAVSKYEIEDVGPVYSSTRIEAAYRSSTAVMHVRQYKDHPGLEFSLRVLWNETFSVAKLCFTLPEELTVRTDGVPGGALGRPRDGNEHPINGWVHAADGEGSSLSVITPDCFSCDFLGNVLRMTLLRSAPFSWHSPFTLDPEYPYPITDRGEHLFSFAVVDGQSPQSVAEYSRFLHTPPRIYDWTRGMDRE